MSKKRGVFLVGDETCPATLEVKKFRAHPNAVGIEWHFVWQLKTYFSRSKTSVRAELKSRQSHATYEDAFEEAQAYGFRLWTPKGVQDDV